MLRPSAIALSAVLLLSGAATLATPAPPAPEWGFAPNGQLNFPASYRDWIFLTAGIDMSYTGAMAHAGAPAPSVFENVFVNPTAYRGFLQTGLWPEHTLLLTEVRTAGKDVSINKKGQTQTEDVEAYEVHVKDSAHIPLNGGWGFYQFSKPTGSAVLMPKTADCYTCHEAHAAVDTTFVQFYPTLIPIAQQHGTWHPKPVAAVPGGAAHGSVGGR